MQGKLIPTQKARVFIGNFLLYALYAREVNINQKSQNIYW